jgi:hypothetical protein
MEIVHVCISGTAGLGLAQQSRDHAGLCKSWVCGPEEIMQGSAGLGGRGLVEIINVCGSLALRAHPMEILLF